MTDLERIEQKLDTIIGLLGIKPVSAPASNVSGLIELAKIDREASIAEAKRLFAANRRKK